jgi:Ala-tRNA(Pro) deacylase
LRRRTLVARRHPLDFLPEAVMSISPTLANYLQQCGAHYELCAHGHSRTSAETARLAHVPERLIAKSVVLEDDNGCIMAVVPGDARVRVSALARLLGRSGLRLTDENTLRDLFKDCDPGAVPAFGMAYGVETAVDDELARNTDVYIESGDHEQLLHMSRGQFSELMSHARHGHFSRMEH